MSSINQVEFMRKAFLPVLPLVYDDALSYIEFLGKVCDKCNEIIEAMNNLDVEILAQARAYTDEQVSYVNNRVDELRNTIENEMDELRRDNSDFKDYVTNEVNRLVVQINSFYNVLGATERAINARTDSAIEQNNEYLLNHMESYLSNIKVVNFITGQQISVQDMFNFLCMYHLTDPLTYTELASKNCDYDTLASYNMTYTELVTEGGTIIQ